MKPSNAYSAKDLQNLKDQSFEGKKLLNNLVDNGPRNKQNLLCFTVDSYVTVGSYGLT